MSTWASRLSTSARSAASSLTMEGRSGRHCTDASPSSSSVIVSPLNLGPGAVTTASEAVPPDVLEEFRCVAEKYNEESARMLRLPPDCWDLVTQYLSFVDVVALGQTCRSLWLVLHERESVWWSQLAYLHQDVCDMRGGKLLCTAPLFPPSPEEAHANLSEGLLLSPTTASSSPTVRPGAVDGRPRPFTSGSRRSDWVPMSAYERFFQERRVYVLDAHREWHFQELADVEDKATGMFTVALHDGTAKSFAPLFSSVTPPPALLQRTTASAANMSTQPPMANAHDLSLNVSPSRTSPMSPRAVEAVLPPSAAAAIRGSSLGLAATTTHHRATSNQTPGTSASNSPALAPSPAPPTPPPRLLPRLGDPIISTHNPLLQLRIYTITVSSEHKRMYGIDVAEAWRRDSEEVVEGKNNDSDYAAVSERRTNQSCGPHSYAAVGASAPSNLAEMSEDEVLTYVMQLSLQEAEAQSQSTAATPRAVPLLDSPGNATVAVTSKSGVDPKCSSHNHYRGGPGSTSLSLSELLAMIDSINNNALDQLHHHQVRDCTADEEPGFLRRLAETLRSAKHRRLYLGNHHSAVRSDGQTTRNRVGSSTSTYGAAFSNPATSGTGGATAPLPPPPMNHMLRDFHGDLLEITESEAHMVASKLLGKPNIIDDFVVFHCHDPNELYRRLHPPLKSHCVEAAAPRTTTATATLEVNRLNANARRQVIQHQMFVSVPAPLYVDPAATTPGGDAEKDSAAASPSLPASAMSLAYPSMSPRTVMQDPVLKALPFFTRFFLAPELCHDGFIALLIVDVVRALVVVDREVDSTDNPEWASPLIDRRGRVVVPGQGYNPQAYTRSDYNYVPSNPPRHRYRE